MELANRCRRCNRWLHMPACPPGFNRVQLAKTFLCNCEEPKDRCRIVGCRNAARYHVEQWDGTWLVMYCGLHEMEHAGGRGKLRRELDDGR